MPGPTTSGELEADAGVAHHLHFPCQPAQCLGGAYTSSWKELRGSHFLLDTQSIPLLGGKHKGRAWSALLRLLGVRASWDGGLRIDPTVWEGLLASAHATRSLNRSSQGAVAQAAKARARSASPGS